EPTFEFVAIGAGGPRQLEGEGVAEIVGAQGADAPGGVGLLAVVPAPDAGQQVVNRLGRVAAIQVAARPAGVRGPATAWRW
ncbi:MAG TPA: hypothetical protein VKY74_20150, partial [Chloroflexia bacterium]|nr:hypothetical protein [Chloroflexia bacterium]